MRLVVLASAPFAMILGTIEADEPTPKLPVLRVSSFVFWSDRHQGNSEKDEQGGDPDALQLGCWIGVLRGAGYLGVSKADHASSVSSLLRGTIGRPKSANPCPRIGNFLF